MSSSKARSFGRSDGPDQRTRLSVGRTRALLLFRPPLSLPLSVRPMPVSLSLSLSLSLLFPPLLSCREKLARRRRVRVGSAVRSESAVIEVVARSFPDRGYVLQDGGSVRGGCIRRHRRRRIWRSVRRQERKVNWIDASGKPADG